MTQSIYISAGEASGDLLGAQLAKQLLKQNPLYKLSGMGGHQMAQAGVALRFDAKRLSVVGIVEILTHLPVILKTLFQIKQFIRRSKPDLVILIDFPDTHLRIAKAAKSVGIPVLYYVSPQLWAWRSSRIHQIKKYVNHMAVLFQFEKKIYEDAGVPVTVVGHPLNQLVKPSMPADVAYRYFGLSSKAPIIALLPGSRAGEIKKHLPLIVESVKEIKKTIPNAQFVLPLASSLKETMIESLLPNDIQIISHHLYDVLNISSAAIAVSGTITLEVALMQLPLCIMYRLNGLSYFIVKRLIKTPYIGLCNIIAGNKVAKEFIQREATVKNITQEIISILTDEAYCTNMKSTLRHIPQQLGNGNASEMVATIAKELIEDRIT